MKTFRLPLLFTLLTMAVSAQDAVSAPPPQPDPAASTTVSVQRTLQELEQLLAPIALYPDALIALILPASTVPTDIVLAARHLQENPGDRAQIEHRAWDESVKSLTNYPEVLKWMDENLHWTRQVGEAFTAQAADVMQAVQRLRSRARTAGTLVDTPQQQVIAEQQVIRIVPAQPDIIYVPHYEPEVVFVDRPIYYSRPFLTFGIGVPVGSWLAYDCDWRHNSIWVGNRHRRWTGHDWRRPVVPFAASYNYPRNVRTPEVRQWRPPHAPRITAAASNRFRSEVVRPAPFGLASSRSNTFRDSNSPRSHSSYDSAQQTSRGSNPASRSRGVDSGSINRSRSIDSASHDRSRSIDSGSTDRARSVDSPPVVPALPRNFTPSFRGENVGPRAAPPVVAAPVPAVPSLPTARRNPVSNARNAAPEVQSPPSARRPDGNDGTRDYGNRSRSFRSSQSGVSAPLPVAPALPMTTQPHNAQPVGPSVNRSFSRRESAPAVVPALPMQRRESAPAIVPALPMHNRSAAPAAVGPVAPQVAPQAAPDAAPQAAPAQRGSGESRGNRFGGGRRPSS